MSQLLPRIKTSFLLYDNVGTDRAADLNCSSSPDYVHNRIRHTQASGAPPKHGENLNVIATDLYYFYEADIWQGKKECVQYDDKLLYKPSNGCRFSNKEFSTSLTFSEAGRSVPLSGSQGWTATPLCRVLSDNGLGRERRRDVRIHHFIQSSGSRSESRCSKLWDWRHYARSYAFSPG